MPTTGIPIQPIRPKKRRWPKAVLIIGIAFVVILASAFGYGYYVLRAALPETEGTLTINGLQNEVNVYRDQNGVPHIEAKNDHDLFMAQGFITAQDRLFQMDLSRRQASGTLSEVVGKATIEKDKFFRTLGLRRAAQASLVTYSTPSKNVLQWYADGVNAYIKKAEQDGKMPPEFKILGYKPKPWTPLDSLTIGKYMAFDLGGHWEGQAFRYYLLDHFPKDKAEALFPSYPEGAPTILQNLNDTPVAQKQEEVRMALDSLKGSNLDLENSLADVVTPHPFNGSNNWVVSGDKTESGKPYLANDPHLGLASPSIWYETELKTSDMNVTGVIFAGVPGIIIGHNNHIAWGVTNVGPDVQDLYIEKRNPENPNEFLHNGNWEKAKVVNEDINVKGGKTVPFNVTITRHGPIISEFAHDKKPNTALSLRWTALDPTTELEAVMQIDKAANWDEFKNALKHFQAPAQNFVFASDDGTIAYRANGLIPIRKKGNSLLPVPGWTDDYEWQGYIPWEQLPTIVNPEEGFIATANNKVAPADYPYHISNTWAQPYREERIREVLSNKDKLSVQDMMALQFDHKNMQAVEFVPIFLKSLNNKKEALRPIDKKAMKLLENWNDQDEKNLGAPLVFNLMENELDNSLFDGKIDKDMLDLFDGKAQTVDQMIRKADKGNTGPWIKDVGGLDALILKSFQTSVDRAVKLQGNNPAEWKWGDFHQVPFHHPLSAVKPLNVIFDPGSTPIGGSCVTVGAACWNEETGEVDHGAPWRSVVDLSDLTVSHSVVGPGESGNVLSPWYDNQIDNWTTGKYHNTYSNPDKYRKDALHLILK
jgi:penicillin G amidase